MTRICVCRLCQQTLSTYLNEYHQLKEVNAARIHNDYCCLRGLCLKWKLWAMCWLKNTFFHVIRIFTLYQLQIVSLRYAWFGNSSKNTIPKKYHLVTINFDIFARISYYPSITLPRWECFHFYCYQSSDLISKWRWY